MHTRQKFLLVNAMTFLLAGLVACVPGDATLPLEESTQVPSKEGSPTRAPQITESSPDGAGTSIQTLWEEGPHAQTYVLDELGMNSTCARCHAPVDYVPSMDDMPESCAACKFEVEPPPPTIAETDWQHIPCNTCHRVKKGEVDPKVAWLSIPPIDEYEDLATTTELCNKCHTKADVANHVQIEVAGGHASYACTQCHDAHSMTASCANEACHADVLDGTIVIPGHDDDHRMVGCAACHDASGMMVGPNEEGIWVTLLPESSTPFMSHNIVKNALCKRCHFVANPWNLPEDVSKSVP